MTPATEPRQPPPALAVGVDVGGTKVLGVALDGDGAVVAEARAVTPDVATDPAGSERLGARAAVADTVAEVVADVVRQVGRSDHRGGGPADGASTAAGDVSASLSHLTVGVGVPGMLDRSGVLRFSPNLPGAVGADLAQLVAERLPADGPGGTGTHEPVLVENDANCAALAELRLGAARGATHALMVTLGTGIGGGLVIDGRVHVGFGGFAGEIGHIVVDPSGPPCPCGRRGCWERYASGGGLGRLAREAAFAGTLHQAVLLAGGDPELVRGEHVTRAALAQDAGALAVVEELGWWVALGLANLVAVCDPQRIVVGGGVAAMGELLLEPTRRAFATLVEGGSSRPAIPIVAAELGERAGAVGAALLARHGPLR